MVEVNIGKYKILKIFRSKFILLIVIIFLLKFLIKENILNNGHKLYNDEY